MVHVNPLQVMVDPVTVLWLNAFVCNLTRSLSTSTAPESPPYVDLRLEAIMPRVVLEAAQDYPLQRDRPSTLHLQTTRLLVCNYRSPDPTAPGYVLQGGGGGGVEGCVVKGMPGSACFGARPLWVVLC